MGFVVWLLTAVYFITSVVLVIIVLMQEPKGGGLSSAFGGAGLDTAFGASIGRKMSSFTVYLAVFFLLMTIGLALLTKGGSGAISGSVMEGMGEEKAGAKQPEEKPAKPAGQDRDKDAQKPASPADSEKKPPAEGTAPDGAGETPPSQGGEKAPASPGGEKTPAPGTGTGPEKDR